MLLSRGVEWHILMDSSAEFALLLHCRHANAHILSCLSRRTRYSSLGQALKARRAREMQLTAVLGPLLLAILAASWSPLLTPGAPEWRLVETIWSLR